jgi:hypothetical protein
VNIHVYALHKPKSGGLTRPQYTIKILIFDFQFQVSLLQFAGFLLPCYVMARSWYIVQSRRRRHVYLLIIHSAGFAIILFDVLNLFFVFSCTGLRETSLM